MRMIIGQPAPPFGVTDVHGHPVRLADFAGKHLLLAFVRYAGCPFCGLRMYYLAARYEQLHSQGLSIVVVTESNLAIIRTQKMLWEAPFAVVADPQHHLFQAYGVHGSLWGLLSGEVRRFRERVTARRQGLDGPLNGNLLRMPAEFLIDPAGTVQVAHYGKDLGDFLPFTKMEQWLKQAPRPA